MACARCDFYTPKGSSKAQLLETKENLQKMRAMIPLTDDEQAALDALLERLTGIPTPAGPTPRQLRVPPAAMLLPVIDVRQPPAGARPDVSGACQTGPVPDQEGRR
jgi:hypothetical protein